MDWKALLPNSDLKKKLEGMTAALGLTQRTLLADQVENQVVQLAQAAIEPGAEVIEISGSPAMLKGKKVRVLAVLS